MRRIWVLILFLAISCQLSAVSGQQSFSESESWIKSQGHKVAGSQGDCLSDSATLRRLCDSASLRPYDFYENQIRLADSLYKNYLPQSNFEEVKKAMEFFDSLTADNRQQSTDNRLRARKTKCTEDTRPCVSTVEKGCYSRTVDCCPLTVVIEFSCAKAHYYHAVGLTERDDIVGACEHYLRALEIMEPLVETSPLWRLMTKDKGLMANGERLKSQVKENAHSSKLIAHSPDYEKIRFLALTYTRLGRMFLNENYCDLAILKYRKALNCLNIIKDITSISYTYKNIGNVYQLLGEADSALLYYNRSIKMNPALTNRLDLEKNIAQILFDKGEKDSAYRLIKNNLDKMDNYAPKATYYYILGEMYYKEKIYDTAVIYLKLSINCSDNNIILASSNYLSDIYELLGDSETKNYYDNISITHFAHNSNRSVNVSELQSIYNNYIEKKKDYDRIKENEIRSIYTILFLFIVLFLCITIISITYYNKKKISNQKSEIDKKEKAIEEIIIVNENLRNQNEELSKTKSQYEKTNRNGIKSYRNCDNCKKILSNIDNIKNNNLKLCNLTPLSNKELTMLLDDADMYLDNYIHKMSNKYPRLKKEDLYCICLLLLNISEPSIAALLGKSYNTIWSRINKIRSILGVNSNVNLINIIE